MSDRMIVTEKPEVIRFSDFLLSCGVGADPTRGTKNIKLIVAAIATKKKLFDTYDGKIPLSFLSLRRLIDEHFPSFLGPR